jgi:hypothetical protein
VVELRDLTRRRKKLLGNLGAEKNRIQKILEVANVKIGNIILGGHLKSGQSGSPENRPVVDRHPGQ